MWTICESLRPIIVYILSAFKFSHAGTKKIKYRTCINFVNKLTNKRQSNNSLLKQMRTNSWPCIKWRDPLKSNETNEKNWIDARAVNQSIGERWYQQTMHCRIQSINAKIICFDPSMKDTSGSNVQQWIHDWMNYVNCFSVASAHKQWPTGVRILVLCAVRSGPVFAEKEIKNTKRGRIKKLLCNRNANRAKREKRIIYIVVDTDMVQWYVVRLQFRTENVK